MNASAVKIVKDQYWDCWTLGEFSGSAEKSPGRPQKWRDDWRAFDDAIPPHWAVRIVNEQENAWREVRVPLARGRRMQHAIALAVSMFGSPAEIRIENGYYGRTIDYTPTPTH